jgi:hypothetical protein
MYFGYGIRKSNFRIKNGRQNIIFHISLVEIYNKESTSSIQLNEDIKNYFIKIK